MNPCMNCGRDLAAHKAHTRQCPTDKPGDTRPRYSRTITFRAAPKPAALKVEQVAQGARPEFHVIESGRFVVVAMSGDRLRCFSCLTPTRLLSGSCIHVQAVKRSIAGPTGA